MRRKRTPGSLATSELVRRLLAILEAEKRHVEGRGYAVPHRIRLKLQWNKFSDDVDGELKKLREELTVAALDFINDNLYLTTGPLDVDVVHDYFVQGVKIFVSYDDLSATDTSAVSTTVGLESGNAIPLLTATPGESPTDNAGGTILTYKYTIEGRQVADRLRRRAGDRIKVGRDTSNDIVIRHPSVSKFHCTLLFGGNGELKIADTGSTNGTIVDGIRIEYGKTIAKDRGCTVQVGDIQLLLDMDHSDDGSAGLSEGPDGNF